MSSIEQNIRGGPPIDYPLPQLHLTPSMEDIGKVPITPPEDTSNKGAVEKDARAEAYRHIGTT